MKVICRDGMLLETTEDGWCIMGVLMMEQIKKKIIDEHCETAKRITDGGTLAGGTAESSGMALTIILYMALASLGPKVQRVDNQATTQALAAGHHRSGPGGGCGSCGSCGGRAAFTRNTELGRREGGHRGGRTEYLVLVGAISS